MEEEEQSGLLREDSDIEAVSVNLSDLEYACSAFLATVQPVAITILLSSLAVAYVNVPDPGGGDQGIAIYKISSSDTSTSSNDKLEESMVNAVAIVAVMALVTFLIVFLYWMRLLSFLKGYMILSSFSLLAIVGGLFFFVTLQTFDIPFDEYSFFFIVWNFSVVGILSIFDQRGVPEIVTQGYLICTSIILSWNLSRIDEYTVWSLLVTLALYDLCAVLSPCGPLKALVGLMQSRRDPLPGLLYEASLSEPASVGNRVMTSQSISSSDASSINTHIAAEAGDIEMVESVDIDSRTQYASEGTGMSRAGGRGVPSQAETVLTSTTTTTTNPRNSSSNSSIKLGLGDFVFYSVLVSRAASKGAGSFLCCFVSVLSGLCLTLVLLSVYKSALPALPISIFIGVVSYMAFGQLVQPTVLDMQAKHLAL